MFATFFGILYVCLMLYLLPTFAKIFFYGVALIVLGIKKAVPWIISAVAALAFGFYALARQFFTGEDVKTFLERRLPPRDVKHPTLSLVLIELMLEIRKRF